MTLLERVPPHFRTPRAATCGALAAAVVVVAGGAMVAVSRGPDAFASLPAPARPSTPAVAALPPTAVPPPADQAPGVVALQQLTPDQALAANQAIPFSTLPNPAAKPFTMAGASDDDKSKAETCLAQAVYYEAGFEPLAGEQAVAQVVLNRVRHPIYPKTVCGVVFQGSELPTGCQFTFTCDGALGRPPEAAAWTRAVAVAHAALNGFVMKAVGEATHYHTQYVVPYWSPTLVKLTQIGQHIFYRWTGAGGLPPAFAGEYAGNEPGAPSATATSPIPLLPEEKLAVVYASAKPAGASAEAAASTHPDPAAQIAAAETAGSTTGGPSDGAAKTADLTPIVLAHADVAPVDTAAPKTGPVQKTFIPAESLVPRPKWKPF